MNTSEQPNVRLPIVPFLVVDALFVGLATLVFWTAHRPLLLWEAGFLAACTGLAGWSMIYPVLRRHDDSQAANQTQALVTTIAQINRLDEVADQIVSATSQWQSVQGCATRISESSKELLQSMCIEVKNFSETIQKASDAEKAHLRLEVDKLRRAEIEWLQTLTRVMDHVYALYFAAARSGQPNLAEQVGQFQEACRDAIRRIGLAPIIVPSGDKFDAQIHQLLDENAPTPENAIVENTLVTGFSYQGQLIRRVVVSLLESAPSAIPPETADKD
jgi:molecular chaperone GrpE (heat shock protein)